MIEDIKFHRRKKWEGRILDQLTGRGLIINGMVKVPELTNEDVLHVIIGRARKVMVDCMADYAKEPGGEGLPEETVDELWDELKGWVDEELGIHKSGAEEVGVDLKTSVRASVVLEVTKT